MSFLDWLRPVPKIQVRFGTPCTTHMQCLIKTLIWNMLLLKNPQFVPNNYETFSKSNRRRSQENDHSLKLLSIKEYFLSESQSAFARLYWNKFCKTHDFFPLCHLLNFHNLFEYLISLYYIYKMIILNSPFWTIVLLYVN